MHSKKLLNEARRIIAAFGHAWAGLLAVRHHPAFRIEMITAGIMIPLALFIGKNPTQRAALIGSLMLVLIVELLNTGIETAIDRVSTEWHPLSKLAKDVGSAAVLLSLVNAGMIWLIMLLG